MYNFDEIIDRKGTNALNTDGFRGYIFHSGPEKVFPYKETLTKITLTVTA